MKPSTIFLCGVCMLGVSCFKQAQSPPAQPEFTNSFKAELDQRIALAEWGYWQAKTESAGGVGHDLYELTNRVISDFKALQFDRTHGK